MATATQEQGTARTLKRFGFQDGPGGFINYGFLPPKTRLMMVVDGGLRSCKTFAGAARDAIYMSQFPKARGMAIGLTDRNLSAGYLDDLFKVFDTFGMQQGVHWEHNKQMGEIHFPWNGAKLFLRTSENIHVSVGATLGFLHIDEPDTMPETVMTELMPRLSQNGVPHHVVITGTPGPPDHWLRKFTDPINYALEYNMPVKPLPNWEIRNYKATTEEASRHSDISGITPEQFEALLTMYGGRTAPLARRQLFGEYVMLEGLAYPTWDAKVHIQPMEKWRGIIKYKVAGVDFGGGNAPTVILIYGTDATGKYRYIIDEWESPAGKVCSEDTLVMKLQQMHEKHGLDFIAPDSADPRWVQTIRIGMAGTGVNIYEPKKDRTFGHTACLAALSNHVDGGQGFFASPDCKGFRKEIERYVQDGPKNQADHYMDTWRYGEITILRYFGRATPLQLMTPFKFTVGAA